MAKRKAEINLAAHAEKYPPRVDDRGVLCINTPFHVPMYIRCFELLDPTEDHNPDRLVFSEGIVGHTLTVDFIGTGVQVLIRRGKDNSLRIFTDDGSGPELIVSYTKE